MICLIKGLLHGNLKVFHGDVAMHMMCLKTRMVSDMSSLERLVFEILVLRMLFLFAHNHMMSPQPTAWK